MRSIPFRPAAIACAVVAIVLLAPTWFVFDGTPEREAFTASGFGMSGVVPGQDHSPMGAHGVLLLMVYLVAAITVLTLPVSDKATLVMAGAGLIATAILLVDRPRGMAGVSLSWAPFAAVVCWLVTVAVVRAAQPHSRTPR
ncbi:hypothetical protein AB0P21_35745 [Kribbella sp. NPDC056861]|uniref:hypothetical protein n=1 Tax=Kribbella sp. NPDC056861 TaxID=3154857 RepID=UPI0034158B21